MGVSTKGINRHMENYTLNLSPERAYRNAITGRFFKGCKGYHYSWKEQGIRKGSKKAKRMMSGLQKGWYAAKPAVAKRQSKPVLMMDAESGRVLAWFKRMVDAERKLGIKGLAKAISNCVTGNQKTAKGYRFVYSSN